MFGVPIKLFLLLISKYVKKPNEFIHKQVRENSGISWPNRAELGFNVNS